MSLKLGMIWVVLTDFEFALQPPFQCDAVGPADLTGYQVSLGHISVKQGCYCCCVFFHTCSQAGKTQA
jgi:hypothetical protein